MKALSLCKLKVNTTAYKNLCLYTSRKVMSQGTKCVFLRYDEGASQAEVLFEGMEGTWKIAKDSLTHVCAPVISFKHGSGQFNIDLNQGFKLNKVV